MPCREIPPEESTSTMSSVRPITTLFLIALATFACGRAPDGEGDQRSSREVLETAQAKAEATRAATFQTPPPTPITPSPTAPLITDTPAPTLTPTPSQPIAIADYNAYVRSGPDESYEHIDFFLEGQRAAIIGMFENELNGTWWFITRLGEGKDGWIWSGAVSVSGDVTGVPMLEAPPQ